MFVCRAGSCSDSAEVPEGTRPRLGSGEQQMLRLLAAVQGTCCPSLAPATPPSVWLDGNTAVHHNPPSVASSPVADNLAVVHACALSWCLRPGWRGGRSPRLVPLNPMGMLPGRGCHRAKRLGRSRHRGQCWCDARGGEPGGIAAASRTEWRVGSFVPQSCFLMG